MNPLFTIAIPVYNRLGYIEEAVESVVSQTETDFELVIVDNCSNDGTWEYLKQLSDERIRVFRNEQNIGMVFNWRKCIEYANGKWFKFLMSDDIMLPGAIKATRDIIENNPQIFVIISAGIGFRDSFTNKLKKQYEYSSEAEIERLSVLSVQKMAYDGKILPCTPNAYAVLTKDLNKLVESTEYKIVEKDLGDTGHDVDFFILYWILLKYSEVVLSKTPLYAVRCHSGNGSKKYLSDITYRFSGDCLTRRLLFPEFSLNRRKKFLFVTRIYFEILLVFLKDIIKRRENTINIFKSTGQYLCVIIKIMSGANFSG